MKTKIEFTFGFVFNFHFSFSEKKWAIEYFSNPIQKDFNKTSLPLPRGGENRPSGAGTFCMRNFIKNIQYFSHTNHKIFVSNLSQIFLKPNLKPNTKNSANPFHFSFCIQLSLFIFGGGQQNNPQTNKKTDPRSTDP